ncbi:MAG: hypothetical protein HRU30_15100, partial [Rhodobacteraceae bacterium]|nr:hypothetical protein [Paracoccaceae bacterium]
MAFIFRWLMRAAGALVVLCVLAVVLVYYLASRSLPDYDATVEVAGLRDQVE